MEEGPRLGRVISKRVSGAPRHRWHETLEASRSLFPSPSRFFFLFSLLLFSSPPSSYSTFLFLFRTPPARVAYLFPSALVSEELSLFVSTFFPSYAASALSGGIKFRCAPRIFSLSDSNFLNRNVSYVIDNPLSFLPPDVETKKSSLRIKLSN